MTTVYEPMAATALPLPRLHRAYFVAVGVFALWVGIWGYFVPASVDSAIPWVVPPLHARFLGSMYLSGAVLLFGSLFGSRVGNVSIALVMAAVWTGMLGVVSFLRLDEFDAGRKVVWFWFFAYIVYPIVGSWLWLRDRPDAVAVAGPQIPALVRRWLAIQGTACLVLAVFLFVAPTSMSRRWPWAISPLLAQIYSGPFLSYGVGSLLVSRRRVLDDVLVPLVSITMFTVLVLTASLVHHDLFTLASPAAVMWFGGFSVASLAMLSGIVGSLTTHRTRL